jgi:LuxR family maltose regulon positive regulatory protein
LVSAPAGYGKTTLLELWRERDHRPFAWLSLEPVHDQPLVLIRSLLQALDPIVRFDDKLAAALLTSSPPVEEAVLRALMDACVASGQSFVLVLDDLHFLTGRRCMELIGYLLKHLPRGCHCALATRTDPALQLACLRAHGQLTELRAAELALGCEEAHALLAAAGAPLNEDLVARLVERTKGWPAALYLAAISLRNRADPAALVDRFAGTSRHVADFLSEDVLARQPPAVTEFLLHTCVLDELTVPLCDALNNAGRGASLLHHLECSNLFVIPLDEERSSYRYHHLFAQYLRAELARRSPALASELHRRAWRWYRAHGHIERALVHAHAAAISAMQRTWSVASGFALSRGDAWRR